MEHPLTYGQCLRKVMESNHLTVSTLSKKMGYHGSTQLSRILHDEVSPALITKFHQQLMLIFDWLISPADIKALSMSLQYSCLGPDSFLTRQAMHSMVFSSPDFQDIPLTVYPQASFGARATLSDALAYARACQSVDILLLGSSFDHLLPAFASLAHHPTLKLRIRHAFILDDRPVHLVTQICALLPFLNANAYEGMYVPESAQEACAFLRGHQIALARLERPDGAVSTCILTPPQQGALFACHLSGDCALFSFYEARMAAFEDQLRPIKAVYPQPTTTEGLLTLCQRDLFLEQRHACCFVRLDLCFHALPIEQVLQALDFGRSLGLSPDDPLMRQLILVHNERYENLRCKMEPTHFILSRPAMRAFVRTGRLSDHLFAMRSFTPPERRAILCAFTDACRANPHLHVHLFRDDALAPTACFSSYADMGVQVSDNHTAYNLGEDHGEAFIGLPAFADALRTYCIDTLIPELCMSEAESLACLDALLREADSSPEA